MSGKWQGKEKFKIASRILSAALDSIAKFENTQVALRVYGHQRNYPPQNCNDTKLEVPFSPNNIGRIKSRLKYIHPRGTSPIAMSLERAKSDFGETANSRNIIILITDGIEECEGDICEISAMLQEKGIAIKPFIIGIGADNSKLFDCAGTYFNAPDVDSFRSTLNIIIRKVMSKTTLQVNLLDKNGKPLETNLNLCFIDKATKKVKYNFIHTLNNKGLPDTMIVDPLLNYDIIVGTLPEIKIENVKLSDGKHNIVYADCLKGKLNINVKGELPPDFSPQILVKDKNKNIINVQSIGSTVSYLKSVYDVDILSLPKIELKNIEIDADKTTEIEIDNPGILYIQKNIRITAYLFLIDGDKQEKILDIDENSSKPESVYLQPGNYRLVYRPIYARQSVFSQIIDFKITSNLTTRIKL